MKKINSLFSNNSAYWVIFTFVLITLATPSVVRAQTSTTFTPRKSVYTPTKEVYNLRGDFTMIGNSNMIAPDGGQGTAINGMKTVYVDIDGDPTTANSSSAVLKIRDTTDQGAIIYPECTDIVYAGLYWSGRAHDANTSPNSFTSSSYRTTYETVNIGTITGQQTNFTADRTIDYTRIANSNFYAGIYVDQEDGRNLMYAILDLDYKVVAQFRYTRRTSGNNPYTVSYRLGSSGEWTSLSNTNSNTNNTLNVTLTSYGSTITITGLRRYNRALSTNSASTTHVNDARITATVSGSYRNYATATKTLYKDRVLLKHDTASAYQPVIASTNNYTTNISFPSTNGTNSVIYVAYAEVTDYVRQYGLGEYTVADMALLEGNGGNTGFYGGWGMVVIYENAKMKWRNIAVFDGAAYIESGEDYNELIVDGFQAVQEGDVNVKIGAMAGEGDRSISGDYFRIARQFNGEPSAIAANYDDLARSDLELTGTNNFFRSGISNQVERIPNFSNNCSFDLMMMDLPNENKRYITNNQTKTIFHYGTDGDTYLIYNIVIGIDAYTPEPEVINIISGLQIGQITDTTINSVPGDTITYVLEVKNKSPEAIGDLNIVIPVPYNCHFLDANILEVSGEVKGVSKTTFYSTYGLRGQLDWYVGDTVPISNMEVNDGLLAKLKYRVVVTTDCSVLVGSETCSPDVIAYGQSSGYGIETGVSFSDVGIIYGLESAPCTNDPITIAPAISINAVDLCGAEITDTLIVQSIVVCVDPGEEVPVGYVNSYFPSGTRYYSAIDEDGAGTGTEYLIDFPADVVFRGDTIYAIPSSLLGTCYWAFSFLRVNDLAITTRDTTICAGNMVDLVDQTHITQTITTQIVSYVFATDIGFGDRVDSLVSPGTTTTYYAQTIIENSQCRSNISPIVVTVAPTAFVTETVSRIICDRATFTVTTADLIDAGYMIPEGTVFSWETPTATNIVASGLVAGTNENQISGTLTLTASVSQGTAYYTVTPRTLTGTEYCEGKSFTVEVTVDPIPAAPATTGIAACVGTAIDLHTAVTNLNREAYTYHFYTSATTETEIPNPTAYVGGSEGNFSLWVSAVSASGCVSLRTNFAVTINPNPAAPTVTGKTDYCSGEAISLSVTGVPGQNSVYWYATETSTERLHSGYPYTPELLTTSDPITATYWVEAVTLSGCPSSRVSVTVNVKPVVTANMITVSAPVICTGSTATFTASVTATPSIQNMQYHWYNSENNETSLQSGVSNTYTTGILTAENTTTYTYYVAISGDNYCTTPADARKATTVTVHEKPELTLSVEKDELCFGSGELFYLNTDISGTDTMITAYTWYRKNAAGQYVAHPGTGGVNGVFLPANAATSLGNVPLDDPFTYGPGSADTALNDLSLYLSVATQYCGDISDTVEITVLPRNTNVILELVSQPEGPQSFCEDLLYTVKITATGDGEVDLGDIRFIDGATSLIEVKNAWFYTYDANGDRAQDSVAMTEIYRAPIGGSSTTHWKFVGDTMLQPEDSVLVQIKVAPTCGFFDGSIYDIQFNGTGICGLIPLQKTETTEALRLAQGDSAKIRFDIVNTFTPDTLITTRQGDTITWRAVYTMQVTDKGDIVETVTSGLEELVFFLPVEFEEVLDSWKLCEGLGFGPEDTSTIVDEYGIEYTFAVPSGMHHGDSLCWEFKFVTSNAPCGEYELLNEVYIEEKAECGGENCGWSAQLGSTEPVLLIQRYDLEVANTSTSYMTGADYGEDGLWHNDWNGTVNLTSPQQIYAGDNIYVEIYVDKNNNNRIDAEDGEPLSKSITTQDLAPNTPFAITTTDFETRQGEQLIAVFSNDTILCDSLEFYLVLLNGPNEVCQGDTTLHFTAAGKTGYTYLVENEEGAASGFSRIPLPGKTMASYSTDSIVRHVWNTPGTYKITTNYTIQGATVIPVNFTVTVNPAPKLVFTNADSTAICQGTAVELSQFVDGYSVNDKDSLIITRKDNGAVIKPIVQDGRTLYLDEPWDRRTYLIHSIREDGCRSQNTLEFTVNINAMPHISSIIAAQHPDCNSTTGAISFSVSGASGSYLYTLDTTKVYQRLVRSEDNDLYTINGLSPGHYTVYIKDSVPNVCAASFSNSITLVPIDNSLTATAEVTADATNCGSTDGKVRLWVSGGYPPYYYQIGNDVKKLLPEGGHLEDPFTAGRHYITISDTTGCQYPVNEIYIESKAFTAVFLQDEPANCEEPGLATLTVGGGTAPYQYQLDGQGWKPLNENPLVGTLTPGLHDMWIKDAAGCLTVDTILIRQAALDLKMNSMVVADATCDGIESGSITINFSAADGIDELEYQFHDSETWTPIQPNIDFVISGLSTGVYDFRVRYVQSGGEVCESVFENIVINLSKEPNISIGSISVVQQPFCDDTTGRVKVVVYGGSGKYEYNLNGGANYKPLPANGEIDSLTSGVYHVYVRDAENQACPVAISPSVRLTPSSTDLIVSATAYPANDCTTADGYIDVLVSGGTKPYTYKLNGVYKDKLPLDGKITGLKSGTYIITINENRPCEAYSQEVIIEATSGLTIKLDPVTNATCKQEGTIKLTVTNGTPHYTYQLLGKNRISFAESEMLISAPAGNHTVTVTDKTGCVAQEEVALGISGSAFAITGVSTIDATCDGTGDGSIAFTIAGYDTGLAPYKYRIDNGDYITATEGINTITGLSEGNYKLFVVDKDSCSTEYDNITLSTIKEPNVIIEAISIVAQPSCTDNTGKIELVVSGGSGAGFKYMETTNPTITGVIGENGIVVINNLTVGTYQFMVWDSTTTACPPAISDYITFDPTTSDLQIAVSVDPANGCNGKDGKITVHAGGGTGPYKYFLEGDTPFALSFDQTKVFDNKSVGTYIVRVEDTLGCKATTTAVVTAGNSGVNLVLTPKEEADCQENMGSFMLQANNGTEKYAYNLDYANFISFDGTSVEVEATAGTHVVTLRDANGCETTGEVTIASPATGLVTFVGITDATCEGTDGGTITFDFTVGSYPTSYTISGVTHPIADADVTEDHRFTITGLAVGTYAVHFTFANNCVVEFNNIKIGMDPKAQIAIQSIYVTEQPGCGSGEASIPGSVQLIVTGGSGIYMWATTEDLARTRPVGANGIITPLYIGTYDIYVWDMEAPNCPAVVSNSITLSPKDHTLYLEVDKTNPTNCTSPNGALTLHVTGNDGVVEYRIDGDEWLPLPADGKIGYEFTSGAYHVEVKDETGCMAAAWPTLFSQNIIKQLELTPSSANCAIEGSITLTLPETVQDGVNWRYQINGSEWRPLLDRSAIEYVPAGTHTIWMVDQDECYVSTTVAVENSKGFTASASNVTRALCDGTYGGTITLKIEGGEAPYTITNSIEGGHQGNIDTVVQTLAANGEVLLEDLATGYYYINITDKNGCVFVVQDVYVAKEIVILNAADDHATTYVGVPVAGNILENDFSYPGSSLTILYSDDSKTNDYGTLIVTENGNFTFRGHEVGVDIEVPYTVQDECGYLSDAILYITILDEETEGVYPIAIPETYSTQMDVPIINIDVRKNDYCPAGKTLTLPSIMDSTANGTLARAENGIITYTPKPGFVGLDEFTYEICLADDVTNCSWTTVSIHVWNLKKDTAIIALPDNYVTERYTMLTVSKDSAIVLNDIYPGNSPVTSLVKTTEHGVLALNEDGTFTYQPDNDFYGTDYFLYELCATDHSTVPCDTTWVYITVVYDECPVVIPPAVVSVQEFCEPAYVSNLEATGQNIKWYLNATDGEPLEDDVELEHNTNYYASQTNDGVCESSARSRVLVKLSDTLYLDAPAINDVTYCVKDDEESVPLAKLFPSLNMNNITWYTSPNEDETYSFDAVTVDKASPITLYAATAKGDDCESAARKAVTITFTTTVELASPVIAGQAFCEGAMISDIAVPANTNITWYLTEDSKEPLAPNMLLFNRTYYAATTAGECQSVNRTPVQITIDTFSRNISYVAERFCGSATIQDLTTTGHGVVWYDALEDGTLLIPGYVLADKATYYAAQTTENCASNRMAVTVDIDPIATPTTITVAEKIICTGDDAVFEASAPGVEDPIFKWYASQNSTEPLNKDGVGTYTPTYPSNKDTVLTYYVSVQGDNYCENLPGNRKEVRIIVDDNTKLQIAKYGLACPGETTDMTVSITGGSAIVNNFVWERKTKTGTYINDDLTIIPHTSGSNMPVVNNHKYIVLAGQFGVDHRIDSTIVLRLSVTPRVCPVVRDSVVILTKITEAKGGIEIITQPQTPQVLCQDTVYILKITEELGTGRMQDLLITMDDYRATGLEVTKAAYYYPHLTTETGTPVFDDNLWVDLSVLGGSGDSLEKYYIPIGIHDISDIPAGQRPGDMDTVFVTKEDPLYVRLTVSSGCEVFGGSPLRFNLDAGYKGCDSLTTNPIARVSTLSNVFELATFVGDELATYNVWSNFTYAKVTTRDSLTVTNEDVNLNEEDKPVGIFTWELNFVRTSDENVQDERIYFLVPPGMKLLQDSIKEKTSFYPEDNYSLKDSLERDYADIKGVEWSLPMPTTIQKDVDTVKIRLQVAVNRTGGDFSLDGLGAYDEDSDELLDSIQKRNETARALCGINELYAEIIYEKEDVTCGEQGTGDTCVVYNSLGKNYPVIEVEWYNVTMATTGISMGYIDTDGFWRGEYLMQALTNMFVGDTMWFHFHNDINNDLGWSTDDGKGDPRWPEEDPKDYFYRVEKDMSPGDTFRVKVGGENFQVPEGSQMIAHAFGDVLCEDLQFPIVTAYGDNGGNMLCQGDTITVKAPWAGAIDTNSYSFTLSGESDQDWDGISTGHRNWRKYAFHKPGKYNLVISYGIKGGYRLTPLTYYINVYPNPVLEVEADSVTVCNNTPVDLTSYVNDNTIYVIGDSAVINYYIMGSDVPLDTNSEGRVVVMPLDTTTYQIIATGTNGCMDTVYFTVNVKPSVLVQTITVEEQPTCNVNTGSLAIEVTGGSGNYLYNFDGGTSKNPLPSNGIISGLAPNTYTVYVWDVLADDCTPATSRSVTLSPVDGNVFVTATGNSIDCAATGGEITIVPIGGNGQIQYFVNDGKMTDYVNVPANGSIGTNFAPGSYIVTVRDEAGCVASDVAVITAVNYNARLTLTANDVDCAVGTDTLKIKISKDVPGSVWEYRLDGSNWRSFIDSTAFEILPAGTYTVEARDVNTRCMTSKTITMGNKGGLEITYDEVSATTCADTASGTITLAISGGTPNYDIIVNGDTVKEDVGTSVDLDRLAAGTYYITVTDGVGCTFTTEGIIVEGNNSFVVASHDENTTYENTSVSGILFGNDYDSDLGTLTLVDNEEAENGEITISSTGVYTYTPNDGFVGKDSVLYTVKNECGKEASAYLYITVLKIPEQGDKHLPEANPDLYAICVTENLYSEKILINDDPGSSPITTVEIIHPTIHGALTLNADHTIGYVPNTGYLGTDQFRYRICNEYGCDSVWSTIVIAPCSVIVEMLKAYPDFYYTYVNEELNVAEGEGILSNDIYPGGGLNVSVLAGPVNGTFTAGPANDGSFTYKPNEDFYGPDSLVYRLCTGELCDTTWVNIIVLQHACPIILPPVVKSVQNFCDSATVANLWAQSDSVRWYSTPEGGTPLESTTRLKNDSIYYGEQYDGECTSPTRSAVKVNITDELFLEAPVLPATMQYCADEVTIGKLFPNLVHTNLLWYTGTAPDTDTLTLDDPIDLSSGDVIVYVKTVAGTCESATPAGITITKVDPVTTTIDIADQSFCEGAAIRDIQVPGGYAIKWYSAKTDGVLLTENTELRNETTYWAAIEPDGCVNAIRDSVKITILAADTVTTENAQVFCYDATVADLEATGYGIQWYDSEDATIPLGLREDLVSGRIYYGVQSSDDCESVIRTKVAVTIYNLIPPVAEDTLFCGSGPFYLSEVSVATSKDAPTHHWYNSSMIKINDPSAEAVIDSAVYYVTEYNAYCESDPTKVTVYTNPFATEDNIIAAPDTICTDSTGYLYASAVGVVNPTIRWYASQTSNEVLYTGSDFNAGVHTTQITRDTAYYVSVEGDNFCENPAGNRKKVILRVHQRPTVVITPDKDAICYPNETVEFAVTVTGVNQIQWYGWFRSNDGTNQASAWQLGDGYFSPDYQGKTAQGYMESVPTTIYAPDADDWERNLAYLQLRVQTLVCGYVRAESAITILPKPAAGTITIKEQPKMPQQPCTDTTYVLTVQSTGVGGTALTGIKVSLDDYKSMGLVVKKAEYFSNAQNIFVPADLDDSIPELYVVSLPEDYELEAPYSVDVRLTVSTVCEIYGGTEVLFHLDAYGQCGNISVAHDTDTSAVYNVATTVENIAKYSLESQFIIDGKPSNVMNNAVENRQVTWEGYFTLDANDPDEDSQALYFLIPTGMKLEDNSFRETRQGGGTAGPDGYHYDRGSWDTLMYVTFVDRRGIEWAISLPENFQPQDTVFFAFDFVVNQTGPEFVVGVDDKGDEEEVKARIESAKADCDDFLFYMELIHEMDVECSTEDPCYIYQTLAENYPGLAVQWYDFNYDARSIKMGRMFDQEWYGFLEMGVVHDLYKGDSLNFTFFIDNNADRMIDAGDAQVAHYTHYITENIDAGSTFVMTFGDTVTKTGGVPTEFGKQLLLEFSGDLLCGENEIPIATIYDLENVCLNDTILYYAVEGMNKYSFDVIKLDGASSATPLRVPLEGNTTIYTTDSVLRVFFPYEGNFRITSAYITDIPGEAVSNVAIDVKVHPIPKGVERVGDSVITVCPGAMTLLNNYARVLDEESDLRFYRLEADGSYTMIGEGDNVYANPSDTTVYKIVATNGYCESDGILFTINVTETPLTATIVVDEQPSCTSESGSLKLVVYGGSGDYQYSFDGESDWKDIVITDSVAIIEDLAVGNYTLHVRYKDATTCKPVVSNTVTLSAADNTLRVTAIVSPVAKCGDEGAIVISTQGGNGTIQYSIDGSTYANIPANGNIGNHGVGIHSISVQDGIGCEAYTPATVMAVNANIDLKLSLDYESACDKKGQIRIEIDPMAGDKWYYRMDGSSEKTFHGDTIAVEEVNAGWRYVTVWNENASCMTRDSIYVPNSNNMEMELLAVSEATCTGVNGGEITLDITGGATPYTISTGISQPEITDQSGEYTIEGLAAGVYRITVTDANGCVVEMEGVEIRRASDFFTLNDDDNYTYAGVSVSGNVLENDYDNSSNGLTVVKYSTPIYGGITINQNGFYTYTPNAGTAGQRDSIIYYATNYCGITDSALLSIEIYGGDIPEIPCPEALNDLYATFVGVPINSMPVTENDYMPVKTTLAETKMILSTTNGTLAYNNDHTFSYTPNYGFTGSDYFKYAISNDFCWDTAEVTINVYPSYIEDEKIIANPDIYFVDMNTTLSVNPAGILANDLYPGKDDDGEAIITEQLTTQNGTVTVKNDGSFIYTPKKDYFGTDYFIYKLCVDESYDVECDTTIVNIFIYDPGCTLVDFSVECSKDTTVTIAFGTDMITLDTLYPPTVTITMDVDDDEKAELMETLEIYNNAPADLTFGYGQHRVTWYVEDECGTIDSCYQWVVVNRAPCEMDTLWHVVNGIPTVLRIDTIYAVDNEGNKYRTVRICDECWTAENLRSTEYSDGAAVESHVYEARMYPN
ncbi:tandem-95 repeat protein, partial [Bacteroidales bacterium OttesenSCG-928-E04]|nr:tandem-95 repeat protein [Bacteroidales bacterium OttesenSCG-928-E04]